MLKQEIYLIVTPKQTGSAYYPRYGVSMRLVSNKPKLTAKELAIKLVLNLPESLFKRPDVSAVIDIPDDVLIYPEKDLMLDITSQKVAEGLHLDATEVRDGLAELLKKQEASRENHETST